MKVILSVCAVLGPGTQKAPHQKALLGGGLAIPTRDWVVRLQTYLAASGSWIFHPEGGARVEHPSTHCRKLFRMEGLVSAGRKKQEERKGLKLQRRERKNSLPEGG